MKLSALKTEERVERPNFTAYGVAGYGKNNDYPQKCLDATSASGTAMKCINIYMKFVAGAGFVDPALDTLVINSEGKTLGQLRRDVAGDIANFHGFCFHLNFNETGAISEINYCPFEYIRLEMDSNKFLTGSFKYYEDWDGRKYGRVDQNKIIELKPYNPENVLSEIQEAGGIDKYNGQLLWVSMDGSYVYPRAIYDPVISDISTEDAIATIKNRNAKNNFLPAGMLVKKGKGESGSVPEGSEDDNFDEGFKAWQGADNSNKIIVCEVDFNEEKPEFIPFPVQNFDKEFTYTEESCQKNIGNAFNQPPVLRGELVAGKLGTANEIEDAYYYYNQITDYERVLIKDHLEYLFKNWNTQNSFDCTIKSLGYTEAETQNMLAVKIGVGGTQSLTSIIIDPVLSVGTKKQLLNKLFSFSKDEAEAIINGTDIIDNNDTATEQL
jgi:hypothetical protein